VQDVEGTEHRRGRDLVRGRVAQQVHVADEVLVEGAELAV
jgi:hypothetical protein